MFLYSVVSSPLDRSKRFILFLPWYSCSFRHELGFSWKHSSHAEITGNDYSLTFPPLSGTHLYRWVDWGVMERTKMPKLRNGNKVGYEPGLAWLRVGVSTTEQYRAPLNAIPNSRNAIYKFIGIIFQGFYMENIDKCDVASWERMVARSRRTVIRLTRLDLKLWLAL